MPFNAPPPAPRPPATRTEATERHIIAAAVLAPPAPVVIDVPGTHVKLKSRRPKLGNQTSSGAKPLSEEGGWAAKMEERIARRGYKQRSKRKGRAGQDRDDQDANPGVELHKAKLASRHLQKARTLALAESPALESS